MIMDALDRLPGSKKFSLPITPVKPKIKTGAGKIVRELKGDEAIAILLHLDTSAIVKPV